MGMIYLLSSLVLLVIAFVVHKVAAFFGWPYGFWASIGTLVAVLVLLSLFSQTLKFFQRGLSISQNDQLMVAAADQPDSAFSRELQESPYRSEVFEVIPSLGYAVADESQKHDNDLDKLVVYAFTDSAGQKSYIANRPSEAVLREPVYWQGDLAGIEQALPLALGGRVISQAVRLDTDAIVVSSYFPRESWKESIHILSRKGEVIGTLYDGEDLAVRDRAYEARMHLNDESADIAYDRLDSSEHFIPFALGGGNYLITYGTDTADFDSFFSTQGYRLPRLTNVFLVNRDNPGGKYVARFTLKDGLPLALAKAGEGLTLQAIDAREREDVKVSYYTLTVNPPPEGNIFQSAEKDVVTFSPLSGTLTLNGAPAAGATITRILRWKEQEHSDTFEADAEGFFSLPARIDKISMHPLSTDALSQRLLVNYGEISREIWSLSKLSVSLYGELNGIPQRVTCELNDEADYSEAGSMLLVTSCQWDSVEPIEHMAANLAEVEPL